MTEAVSAEAVAGMVAGATHVVRQLSQHPGYEGSFIKAKEWIEASSKALTTLAAEVEALRRERNEAQKALRVVQNAAKTIASAHGTELEHLRQNKTYDHKLRAEHESLLDRDAQMTDALLAAEARADSLAAELAQCREALKRQSDNMAFIINHVTLPDQWRDKFMRELEEDRARTALKGTSQ